MKLLLSFIILLSISGYSQETDIYKLTTKVAIANKADTAKVRAAKLEEYNKSNNSNLPVWEASETRSISDSIFYARPRRTTVYNLSGDEIKAGEVFYRTGCSADGEEIYLRSKNGIETFCFTNENSDYIDNIDYKFWGKSYVDKIKKKYGLQAWKDIVNKYVRIGWGKELCRISWGEPEDINTTISAYGREEQWVYGSSYLYFTDGKLTTIQN